MSLVINDETELVVELWEKMKEFINLNKRDDAAIIFVETFLDNVSFDKNEVAESDTHLENAIIVLDGENQDDEDVYDEDANGDE